MASIEAGSECAAESGRPSFERTFRETSRTSCGRRSRKSSSPGYEAVAASYIAGRGTRRAGDDAVGTAMVRSWASTFLSGAAVLDLGCGPGEPVTRVLLEAGLSVCALDASPSMVAAFRERFPRTQVECNTVEASDLFGRRFDGVVAWGLLFLLEADAQARVIAKVGRTLEVGGHFLFTAPKLVSSWRDAMTDRLSRSLGAEVYERLLRDAGMLLVRQAQDEGENHYYFATKR